MQQAVDAQAHHRLVALGLDVDVAGALVEGVVEEVLHGVDDVLVVGLDLRRALEPHELLEVAQVGALAMRLLGLGERGSRP